MEHQQSLGDQLWEGQQLPQYRTARIPDINVFGLVLCVVFGGFSFGVVGVLPYFNLSAQHVGLLFHNAVRIVGPALAQEWAHRFALGSGSWIGVVAGSMRFPTATRIRISLLSKVRPNKRALWKHSTGSCASAFWVMTLFCLLIELTESRKSR